MKFRTGIATVPDKTVARGAYGTAGLLVFCRSRIPSATGLRVGKDTHLAPPFSRRRRDSAPPLELKRPVRECIPCILGMMLVVCTAVMGSAIEIPCEIEQGVILLRGQINGQGPQKFILDTGATQTVITPPTARKLGMDGMPVGGGPEVGRVAAISVGDAMVKNLEVFIFDPPQAVSLRLDHGINYTGILGYTFLTRFVTTIDYPNKVIHLDPVGTGGRAGRRPSATEVPFELVDHHVFVKGFVNGKGPLVLLCDTGASETILTRETAREFGFTGIPMQHPSDASYMEGAAVALDELKVENLPVILHTPVQARMYGINYQGILGHTFLSRFVIAFDYDRKTLVFSLPDPRQ